MAGEQQLLCQKTRDVTCLSAKSCWFGNVFMVRVVCVVRGSSVVSKLCRCVVKGTFKNTLIDFMARESEVLARTLLLC